MAVEFIDSGDNIWQDDEEEEEEDVEEEEEGEEDRKPVLKVKCFKQIKVRYTFRQPIHSSLFCWYAKGSSTFIYVSTPSSPYNIHPYIIIHTWQKWPPPKEKDYKPPEAKLEPSGVSVLKKWQPPTPSDNKPTTPTLPGLDTAPIFTQTQPRSLALLVLSPKNLIPFSHPPRLHALTE